jgi:two-component system cell cycle sensor histidine kinase/response regulator CckA
MPRNFSGMEDLSRWRIMSEGMAHDLFLLMLYLTQIKNRERVLAIFLEAINNMVDGAKFYLPFAGAEKNRELLEIATNRRSFGHIAVEPGLHVIQTELQPLIRNAVKMLAVILEKLDFEALLSDEKTRLETEAKRAEANERLLATAVEQAAEGMVITDAEGLIQYANPAFQSMSGFSLDEMIGQRAPQLLFSGKHEDSFYEAIQNKLATGQTWHGNIINRGKDSSLFEMETTISPVRDASGKIVNYIFEGRDVTREVQLEVEYRQAQKLRAIGQLAGGVAHDFNNLLQAIRGYTDLAVLGLPSKCSSHEDLNEVIKVTERAKDLVRQLMTFSRRETVEGEYVNLDKVIAEMVMMLRRILGEHVELSTTFGSGLQTIFGNPGQIAQILMNLCVNARDAMPLGGTIRVETADVHNNASFVAHHPWAKVGAFVRLTVADTGTGMSPETLEHIFEPFFTTKGVGQGTGLGLATVYGIVKQHNGLIHVESEPDRGTSFQIYFPALRHEFAASTTGTQSEPSRGGSETILLAEDDGAVRTTICRILELAGYKVITAQDGEQAMRIFNESASDIDLVLLDVVLPKLSGKIVADRIKATSPLTPLIFSSGYDFEILAAGFEPGAEMEMVRKPYDREQLLLKIREVLDAARNRKTSRSA